MSLSVVIWKYTQANKKTAQKGGFLMGTYKYSIFA